VVEILQAVTASTESPDAAAVELRDRAREAILKELGEPDLHVAPVLSADLVQGVGDLSQ